MALIPYPHGEQVHARCMLDHAKVSHEWTCLPAAIAVCRSEWQVRNQPLHPVKLAEDLARPRPGGR